MVGWPGMMDPLNMHGEFLFCLGPRTSKVARAFLYQWLGLLFNPYRSSYEFEVCVLGGNG